MSVLALYRRSQGALLAARQCQRPTARRRRSAASDNVALGLGGARTASAMDRPCCSTISAGPPNTDLDVNQARWERTLAIVDSSDDLAGTLRQKRQRYPTRAADASSGQPPHLGNVEPARSRFGQLTSRDPGRTGRNWFFRLSTAWSRTPSA